MSRYKLPLVAKKSTLTVDYRSRGYSSSLSNNPKRVEYVRLASLKSESNLDISEPSQIYEEDDGGFALTGIRESQSVGPVKTRVSVDSSRESIDKKIVIELPAIGKK